MLQMFANPSESTFLPFAYSQAGSEARPGFLSVTPYIRQSMPVPPSTLSDPVQYIQQLDSQMRHIGSLSTISDWQAYLKTSSLVPYVRSVAAGRIAGVENAYCQLAGTAQSSGIWRSIADGVSDPSAIADDSVRSPPSGYHCITERGNGDHTSL